MVQQEHRSCNINAYQQFQPRCKLMPDAGVPLGKGFERHGVGWLVEVKRQTLKKSVSLDRTRPCIQTSNNHKKIQVRIHSTVKVTQACMFRVWSVLEGTPRASPTGTITTISRTTHGNHATFAAAAEGPAHVQRRTRIPSERQDKGS